MGYFWVVCGFMAGLLMGSGAFIFASNFSEFGFKANGLLGPGTLIVCVGAKLAIEVSYFLKHRRWFKESGSAWRTPEGKFKWTGLLAVAINCATNFGYTLVMNLAWRFARIGGLNQGIVSTMLSLASIFNLFVFYLIWGEKANYAQLLGTAFMILAITCMGTKLESQEEQEGVDTGYIYWALLTAFAAPILMSAKHVCVRFFKAKFTYGPVAQAVDGFLVEYALFSLIAIADPGEFQFKDYLVATGAGILMCSARVFINVGVAIGIAGPV
jgi:drug/metabolite transporter (DMT)-like permease